MSGPLELDDVWLNRIKQSVEGLEYGSVQIIVHDGRIVQIERTERRRYDGERAGIAVVKSADAPPAKRAENSISNTLTFARQEGINENNRISEPNSLKRTSTPPV